MSIDVQNKTILVTGANRGIGKAIVESFIKHGASAIYAAVRDLDSLLPLSQQYGAKIKPLQVDVGSRDSIQALAKQAMDVDIVVNNAGVLAVANPLSENAEEALEHELNINTFGLLRMAQAFAPILEKNKGALVQLNSVASIKNFTDFTTYSASKAATYSITQGLRDVFLEKGVHVLSVHPGPIATDMAEAAGMTEMTEPSSVVAEGIVTALKTGDFHLFPDSLARDFYGAYKNYAENMIELQPPIES